MNNVRIFLILCVGFGGVYGSQDAAKKGRALIASAPVGAGGVPVADVAGVAAQGTHLSHVYKQGMKNWLTQAGKDLVAIDKERHQEKQKAALQKTGLALDAFSALNARYIKEGFRIGQPILNDAEDIVFDITRLMQTASGSLLPAAQVRMRCLHSLCWVVDSGNLFTEPQHRAKIKSEFQSVIPRIADQLGLVLWHSYTR